MAEFVSELYGKVLGFLWEIFVYFKRSTSGIRKSIRAVLKFDFLTVAKLTPFLCERAHFECIFQPYERPHGRSLD